MFDVLRLVTETAVASPWLLAVIVGLALLDALLPVVPSEATIIAAGVAAAAGQQDLLLVIGAAGLGAFLGEVIGYLIGRGIGPAVRTRLAGGSRADAFDRVARLLERRGGTVLLTARFIPAGRTAAVLAAGATGYPAARFAGYTVVGAWLSAAWVGVLGYAGGTAFAGQPLVALGVSFGLATVIGLVADVVRRLRRPAAAPVPAAAPAAPVSAGLPVSAGVRGPAGAPVPAGVPGPAVRPAVAAGLVAAGVRRG